MFDKRENVWSRHRATAGFTMVEVLLAVGLMVVLMGVSFVAVQNYQRTLKQTELDGIAKELYIAAQNHLTVMETQGTLQQLYDMAGAGAGIEGASNQQLGYCHKPVGDEGTSTGAHTVHYYWFVKAGEVPDSNVPNTLAEMLPFGSIDSVVRATGSYVIEYDVATASVINVFFSDQSNLSKVSFNENDFKRGKGDYGRLFSSFVGPGGSGQRLTGFSAGDDSKNVIGWYGGADLKGLETVDLYPPVVRLVNKEALTVEVDFSRLKEAELNQNRNVAGAKLNLYLYGNTSKNTQLIMDGVSLGGGGPFFDVNLIARETIDDITKEGKHFVEQYCQPSAPGDSDEETGPLIPGEDITVYAEVFSTNTLVRIRRSNSAHSNSLFDAIELVEDSADDEGDEDEEGLDRCIVVSNIRHLENLDTAISGYLRDGDDISKLGDYATTKVRQVADLKWAGSNDSFTHRIASANGDDPDGDDPEEVQVTYVNEPNNNPTAKGTFAPVTPAKIDDTPFDYDGESHSIAAIVVDDQGEGSVRVGPAGLFATLPVSGSSVKNLELVNCDISTTEGDAGTLVAATKVGNLKFTNILVHDADGTKKSLVKTSDTSDQGGAAGGLIGKMTNAAGVEIDGCASAVYVAAQGENSYAGGLIGQLDGAATLKCSYVGGHTKEADYLKDAEVEPKRFNVDATNGRTAGGFVGSMNGGSIEYCYSTASAAAKKVAGGFIGDCKSAVIKNSYATGLVTGIVVPEDKSDKTKAIGTFVGSADKSATFANDLYYSIVNEGMRTVGTVDVSENSISAFDKDLTTFNKFYQGEKGENADPYDDELLARYREKYPLQTIAELTEYWNADNSQRIRMRDYTFIVRDSGTLTDGMHYGDYPDPITYVVNER